MVCNILIAIRLSACFFCLNPTIEKNDHFKVTKLRMKPKVIL